MPGLVDFQEIRAFFDLLPNHRHQFRGVVGLGRVRQNVLRRIEPIASS